MVRRGDGGIELHRVEEGMMAEGESCRQGTGQYCTGWNSIWVAPLATTDAVSTASTVLPSQPVALTKPARRGCNSNTCPCGGSLGYSGHVADDDDWGSIQAASHTKSALGGSTPAQSPSPAPALAPAPAPYNQITHTSTTSVAAYFAAKMRARQLVAATATATPPATSPFPRLKPKPNQNLGRGTQHWGEQLW